MGGKGDKLPELREAQARLERYGVGCPQLQTGEDVREWLAALGERFAIHFRAKTRGEIFCQGWGPPHRRGGWLYPLTFTVGPVQHVFYLTLPEMHSLEQAPQEQQLLVSERLYQWLEELAAATRARQ